MNRLLLSALLTLLLTPAASHSAETATKKIRIILVGDSTVNTKSGWGDGFKQLLTERAECFNTAANGRSSKSFIAEGKWTNALALKGDYYLIQFGHNDEPGKGADRETTVPEFHNFMTRYVEETRAIGATPILVTCLTRRPFDSAGKLKPNLVPQVAEIKKIAAEKKVPLLDLNARSIEVCEKLGRAGCLALSPEKQVNGTNTVDNTHLNAKGSELFGRLVAEELVRTVPALAPCFKVEPSGTRAAKGE
jgi:pectinesterase